MELFKWPLIFVVLVLYYLILVMTLFFSEFYFIDDFLLFPLLPIVLVVLPIVLIFLYKKRGRLFSIVLSFMILFMYTTKMATVNHYIDIEKSDFSSTKWKSSKYCEYRHYMVNDLMYRYSFVGMVKAGVDNILGNVKNSKCGYDYERDNKTCYFLKTGAYFGQYEYFCVYFNDKGFVKDVKVEIEYESTINYDKLELYK